MSWTIETMYFHVIEHVYSYLSLKHQIISLHRHPTCFIDDVFKGYFVRLFKRPITKLECSTSNIQHPFVKRTNVLLLFRTWKFVFDNKTQNSKRFWV